MDRELVSKDNLATQMQKIATEIQELAEQNQEDLLFLLFLLRNLEQIHRQIRTTMFETSLPSTRNNLYNLVKDIEEEGGWPYIERMKLRQLLQNMEVDPVSDARDS